jgi:FKBP-type peptidyl-prolyl cis-trans isomerase
MKILPAISPTSESKIGIGVDGVKMNLANPQQPTSSGFLHTVLLALVLSFVMGSVAQADSFRSAKGGMKVKDMKTGTGLAASEGMIATIQFTGWLDNQGVRGKELYNSRNSGEPVSFVIGTDKVMPAWNEGLLGMRTGGRRMLLVPPGMAYGKRAIDDVIPADSSMQFIIELVRLEE